MGAIDHKLGRRMDELAMKSLELMDHILARRGLLDGVLKEGFIDMAKARYSMGNHAVSVLQLPTEDSDVEAKRKVFSRTVSENVLTPYTEFSVELVTPSPPEPDKDGTSDENVLRKRNTEETAKFKEVTTTTVDSSTDAISIKLKKRKDVRRKDPLLWFGVLVPTNLKESQKSFQKALSITCEIATMHSELDNVCHEFRSLRKQKGEGDAEKPYKNGIGLVHEKQAEKLD